jgi:hypothetical protein
VAGVTIDANNNRVVLNITAAIPAGATLRVDDTPPNTNPVADKAGNVAAGFSAFSVSNKLVTTDTTAPALSSVSVNGNKLVLKYSDSNLLDRSAAGTPANGDFTLTVAGTAITPNANAFTGHR